MDKEEIGFLLHTIIYKSRNELDESEDLLNHKICFFKLIKINMP